MSLVIKMLIGLTSVPTGFATTVTSEDEKLCRFSPLNKLIFLQVSGKGVGRGGMFFWRSLFQIL